MKEFNISKYGNYFIWNAKFIRFGTLINNDTLIYIKNYHVFCRIIGDDGCLALKFDHGI